MHAWIALSLNSVKYRVCDVESSSGPPFVWVWDFLGQCPRMVHELFTNLRIPDAETLTKTFHLHNFYLHFQRFEGPRFQNFPGGACPRTSLAYKCLHVCYKPPLQNARRSPSVTQAGLRVPYNNNPAFTLKRFGDTPKTNGQSVSLEQGHKQPGCPSIPRFTLEPAQVW